MKNGTLLNQGSYIPIPLSVKKKIPQSSKRFEKEQIVYYDMPIGRTPEIALEGKLNLMIGGQKESFSEKDLKLLGEIAQNLYFLEKLGNGIKCKLLNNLLGQSLTLLIG